MVYSSPHHPVCALATVVLFREELVLAVKQEMAAVRADYEQDKQKVGGPLAL